MSTVLEPPANRELTLVELAKRLGPMSFARIRATPQPGTATEDDFLAAELNGAKLCELIDGVLVEKTRGYPESVLAGWILTLINNFIIPRRLGEAAAADGAVRLEFGQIRLPDVSFTSAARLRERPRDRDRVSPVAPNLAVEVISDSNTNIEMDRKLHEYFAAGVELVWYVDPTDRTVRVYESPERCQVLTVADSLSGGSVLQGFEASVRELFAVLERPFLADG